MTITTNNSSSSSLVLTHNGRSFQFVKRLGKGREGGVSLYEELPLSPPQNPFKTMVMTDNENNVEVEMNKSEMTKLVAIKTVDCSTDHLLLGHYSKFNDRLLSLRHENIVEHYAYWYEKYRENEHSLFTFQQRQSTTTAHSKKEEKTNDDGIEQQYEEEQEETNSDEDEYFTSTMIRYCMEYVDGPNLKTFMKRHHYNVQHIVRWVRQIALGLNYLHQNEIIHRDIKPENLIIFYPRKSDVGSSSPQTVEFRVNWTEDNLNRSQIKIADFGMGKQLLSDLALTNTGTPLYQSPENARALGHDSSTDIWSLGMIILELLLANHMESNRLVYSDLELLSVLNKHRMKLTFEETNKKERIQLFNYLYCDQTQKLCNIMFECLAYNPVDRVNASEIVQYIDDPHRAYINLNPKNFSTPHTPIQDEISTQDQRPSMNYEWSSAPLLASTIDSLFYEMDEARSFWVRHFESSDVRDNLSWGLFHSSYCAAFGRLNGLCNKGLRKLLASERKNGELYVTIYVFSECCERYGFPFTSLLLEKVEKYGDSGNCRDSIIVPKEISDEIYNNTFDAYMKMIVQHDGYIRDIFNNGQLSIEDECIPLEVFLPSDSQVYPVETSLATEDKALSTDFYGFTESESTGEQTESDMDVDPNILLDTSENVNSISVLNLADFIINNQNRAVLAYGSPASGKTTLLRMVMYNLAKRYLTEKQINRDVEKNDYYVPILLSVSLLSQQLNDETEFDMQVLHSVNQIQYNEEIQSFLLRSITKGRVLLLCDGLDESCSREAKRLIEERLLQFIGTHTKHRLIITSRISSQLSHMGFVTAKLLPLSIDMQIEVSKKRGVTEEEFLSVLRSGLYSDLARTPMLLSLLINLYKADKALPTNRSEIYHQAVESMLNAHFKRLRVIGAVRVQADELKKQRTRIYELIIALSEILHTHRMVYFSEEQVLECPKELQQIWSDIQEMVDDGKFAIITPTPSFEQKRYRFSHLSFQEYLVSQQWKRGIIKEMMKGAGEKSEERIERHTRKRQVSFSDFFKAISFKDSLPKVHLETVNEVVKFVTDVWYKEVFIFLSQDLPVHQFVVFCYALLSAKKHDFTYESVLLKLIQDSQRQNEHSMREIIYHLSSKRKQRIIIDGIMHHNQNIRRLTHSMWNLYNSHNSISEIIYKLALSKGNDNGVHADALADFFILLGPKANVSVLITHGINTLSETPPTEQTLRQGYLKRVTMILRILSQLDLSPPEYTDLVKRLVSVLITFIRNSPHYRWTTFASEEAAVICLKYCASNISQQCCKLIVEIFLTSLNISLLDYKSLDLFKLHTRYEILSTLIERRALFFSNDEQKTRITSALYKAFSEPYSLCGYALGSIRHALNEDQEIVDMFLSSDLRKDRSFWMHMCDALSIVLRSGFQLTKEREVKQKLLALFPRDWIIRDKSVNCLLEIPSHDDGLVTDMAMNYFRMIDTNNAECSILKCLSTLIFLIHQVIRPSHDRELLGILMNCTKHEKFDVRREAIRACSDLLFNPNIVHPETVFDFQIQMANLVVFSCIQESSRDSNDFVQAEIIEHIPTVLTWLLNNCLLSDETMNSVIINVINLIHNHRDTSTRIACAKVLRHLPLTKRYMIYIIETVGDSKYHIDIRRNAIESIVYVLSKYNDTDDIISKLIGLLKPEKHNHSFITLQIHGKYELGSISDNDIVFDALMQLMSKEIPNLPRSPSHLLAETDPFTKVHHKAKRVLTDKHIEEISRKGCLEGDYLLLAHFWKTKLK